MKLEKRYIRVYYRDRENENLFYEKFIIKYIVLEEIKRKDIEKTLNTSQFINFVEKGITIRTKDVLKITQGKGSKLDEYIYSLTKEQQYYLQYNEYLRKQKFKKPITLSIAIQLIKEYNDNKKLSENEAKYLT